jgi:hypothetical protein
MIAGGGPFHQCIDRGSDTLVVAFSSWNAPAGRFRPYRLLLSLPYSLLFVNCPANAWYLTAIPGLGRSPDAAIEALQGLIAASGCRRVVTYGGSMGGFGAIRFGLALAADAIVVHGVDALIGLAGSRSARGIGDRSLLAAGRQEVRSWRDKAKRFPGRIHFFIGETDIQDGLHAAYFRKLTGIAPKVVRGASHLLERFIDAEYGFARFFGDLVDHGGGDFGRRFCDGVHDVRRVAEAYRWRRSGLAASAALLTADTAWPGTHMLRIAAALLDDRPEAALAAAREAVGRRPDFEFFHYVLVILRLRQLATEGAAEPAAGTLRVLFRRSYLPKQIHGQGGAWLQVALREAVIHYHEYLKDELLRTGLLAAGTEAAAEMCRSFPDNAHLRRLLARLQGGGGAVAGTSGP